MSTTSMLLQGGTVLVHDADDSVKAIKADLLIEGKIITKIEENIEAPARAEIIDCKDKIVCPGFIDTHHHVWQTLLKGRHANQLLLDYMYTGNFTSSLHSPSDIFWGQLGGCMECLEVGTTTVVDHSPINYSPQHSLAAVAATVCSGIRSIYCYCPTSRVQTWTPFTLNPNLLEDWVLQTFDSLASKAPYGQGRVQIGFAFDSWYQPRETIVNLFAKVKAAGVKLITSHVVRNAITGLHSVPQIMHNYGLLDSSVLLSHATGSTKACIDLIREANCHISTTPSTEFQAALGSPVALDPELDIQSQCGLGIDCHSYNSASIASEMRTLLQSARGAHYQPFLDYEKVPGKAYKSVEDVFNLGTIGSARAAGMEKEIGSLAVDKLADILIFDCLSPGMVCAAQLDPVAAIVLHSHPGDIEMVIVDGVVRKKERKLLDIDLNPGNEIWSDTGKNGGIVCWKEVSKELQGRQMELGKKIDELDMDEARKGLIKAFRIDESKLVSTT
ncbi:hypothetical protein BP5796_03873 [Coleophoma crateriformis]|uniref:Amidohydrolase-related domain-containing protein n=1 Tax=Coleophoma crateriformis TaxID=565419 RepID=A0A3D8SID9_9HELO|nr:hypothetical protein BP5796_03873 [Coleophoma crateriformis]